MHSRFSNLCHYIGLIFFTWVLSPLVTTGCVYEDLSGCLYGSYSIAFEFVNHTDAEQIDRFHLDVQRLDLFVFDSTGHFVKCITNTESPFSGDFHIDPELSDGSYTLVAWGNFSDEVIVKPVFVAGRTTFEEALLSLNTADNQSVNKKLTPVFHAIKQVEVDYMANKTDILSFVKNENQLNLKIKWFEKSGIPCIHSCADGVRIRVVDTKGATYKFDNSVVASGNELIYTPFKNKHNDDWNELDTHFSLMRLVDGELLTLRVERPMQDGTVKELYCSDLVSLIQAHPYTRTQMDLDRRDFYEIELSLIDDLDGDTDTFMQAAITVAGWTIILQDTGI